MGSISVCLALFPGILVAAPALAAPADPAIVATPSDEPSTQIVPVYLSRTRPVVMLTLGDAPPAPVIFDTGSDENLLTEPYVEWLKLKTVGTSKMVDGVTHKSTDVPLAGLPDPRIGGAPVAPPTAQVFSWDEPDSVGIFGPQSFAGRLVTMELGLSRLRISKLDPEVLPQNPGTPHIEGTAAMGITVAGIPLTAGVDSGATGDLMLNRALLGKLPLKAPAKVVGKAQSVSGVHELYGGQIDGEVVIGPLRLKDPQVTFIDMPIDANVGFDLLRQLTLVIDPAGKRSWVLNPKVGMAPIAAYAGRFGERAVRVEGDALIYQRRGRPAFVLHPVGSGLFENSDTGDRIQFRMDGGKAVGFDLITPEGQVVLVPRTG